MVSLDDLNHIALQCTRLITNWAGPEGFTFYDLLRRYELLAPLSREEQFRVMVLISRSEMIAVRSEPGLWLDGWHFWARHHAPKGAYNVVEHEAQKKMTPSR